MLRALLLAIVLGWARLANAECSCLWGGPFVEVQQATDLVAVVEVGALKGNSVDLQLQQVLRGEEYREQLRLWLDTGELCRAPVGSFEIGTRWIMALEKIRDVKPGGFNPNTPNLSYGRLDDYSLSRCGGYWLRLQQDLVTGNLVEGARWEMNPKMSPVLLQLVQEHLRGELSVDALREAGRVDPELQRLRIETRSFLRGQGEDFRGFSAEDAESSESDAR